MTKRNRHDLEEASSFDDEEAWFERTHKNRGHRPPAKSPKELGDGSSGRRFDKPNRRRRVTTMPAFDAPYSLANQSERTK